MIWRDKKNNKGIRGIQMATSIKRIEWLDVLKGIGILFVIWGHGLVKNTVLYNMIWSVHMPLFFYASGYTYTKRSLSEQIRRDIKGLLFPYGGGVLHSG